MPEKLGNIVKCLGKLVRQNNYFFLGNNGYSRYHSTESSLDLHSQSGALSDSFLVTRVLTSKIRLAC